MFQDVQSWRFALISWKLLMWIGWLGMALGLPGLDAAEKDASGNNQQSPAIVYTRKGANNDHVFRNRAPLFIAQVDPVKRQVIRRTERILIPERGAGLGNAYGVTPVSADETWVTTAEWMQGPKGILLPGNQYGSDNSVYAARIIWKTPNRHTDKN